MHCFICGDRNFSQLPICKIHTCKALISTAEVIKYYTAREEQVTTREEQRTVLGGMEHYIAICEGELVDEHKIPAGIPVDTALQIQGSGFRALVVLEENCGKIDCWNAIRCPYSSFKISIAEKSPAGYDPTKTFAYPEIETEA